MSREDVSDKKSKINYVIASYEGEIEGERIRNTRYFPSDIVLKTHLEKIFQCDNKLSQVTLMKAKCDRKKIENYYENIEHLKEKIEIIECENYGYSEGQWLRAYELDKTFDYYLFMEDDYCPNMDNFDSIFIDIYKKKFPDNIGVLCSVVEGTKNYNIKNKKVPIHFEGCVFVSKETLEKLYNDKKWENDPRKWLDLIDKSVDSGFDWDHQKRGYIGGYYQVSFSHLFTLSGIEHEDYLEEGIDSYKTNLFLYWHDGDGIWPYSKKNIRKNNFTIEDIIHSLIIPIQLSKVEYIIQNTDLDPFIHNYPGRICFDIVENFKNILKGKSICDLGCGEGDILEYIRINKYAKKVLGIENIFKNETKDYVIQDNILNCQIPEADIYYFWLGGHFKYHKITSQFKKNTIVIYGDGSIQNHKNFQKMTELECENIIEFDYDELRFHKDHQKYRKEIESIPGIRGAPKGKRIFGIYKK